MNQGRTTNAKKVPGAGMINSILAALVLPVWLFALAAWAVQLGGLSAVQYSQGRHYLQFDWFITALEFVSLIFVPIHLLARRSTPGILALVAVVTVLEILRTNVWNNARLGRSAVGQNYTQIDSLTNPGLTASAARSNTLLSGYLITAAANCLLIITLGNLPGYSGQDVAHLSNKGKQGAEHLDTEAACSSNADQQSFPAANVPSSNGVANGNPPPSGPKSSTRKIPPTHLRETQQADGLAGPTYIEHGSNV